MVIAIMFRPFAATTTNKTKNTFPMKTNPRISIILASLFAAGAASAAPITGSIKIASFNDSLFTFNTTTNQITFGGGPAVQNSQVNDTPTGSYSTAGVALSASVHYNSFNYGTVSGPLVVTPLWATLSGTAASFNLLSITSITEGSGGVVLTGNGTAILAGFDNTSANWTFSASSQGGVFNWSSTNSRVPDGGATLALLGLSVLGLGGVRRFLPSLKK